jgi:heme/copper-type cytochrome/quinol oxidase subunit 2
MNIKHFFIALTLASAPIYSEVASAAPPPATFILNSDAAGDISQKNFSVAVGQKVRLQVNPKETATGCMSDIMIPGLWNKPQLLVKGRPVVMEFTPTRAGTYKITCSMSVSRGTITVR